MRLLHYNNKNEFSLTEFFESEVPEYAILSHRWEAEEATFSDIQSGTGTDKAGYEKIRFCGQQAGLDGLEYFWVDTCCIDKSSSAELAEAINSMFRWYQKATRCYVYLSDVSTRKRKAIGDATAECTWEPGFRASEWFTRGWTLQELLAPSSVEFFSRDSQRLGDKNTLKQQIHEITGIPVSALEGTPLSQFEVDKRLSWAEKRQTTRGEDKAYSLMGIFDIHMTLIYGEGSTKAFNRLRNKIDKYSAKSPPAELECRLAELTKNFATIAKENELLKLQLKQAATENEILKATSLHSRAESSEVASTASPPRYNPTDLYTDLLSPRERKAPSHRIITGPTGERLLAAGAAWDHIIQHPLYKQGLLDVGDVSERLKGVARCDGDGPVFLEEEISEAIERSYAATSGDELL